jgi:hypothetical protein
VAEETSVGKLREIAGRLNRACGDPNSRPTMFHWSDGQLMLAIATELEEAQKTIEKLRNTLSLHFKTPGDK